MLSSGLSAIEQAALTTPIIVYYTILASSNSLTGFLNEYYGGTGYLGGIPTLLRDPAFSFGFILVIAIIILTAVLVGVVGGGFVLSSEYGIYLEAWAKNSVSIGSVLDNGRRNWKRAAWTLLLTDLVTWGPAALGIIVFFLAVVGIGGGTPGVTGVFTVLLFGLLAGVLIIVSIVISVFTIYSIPAAIVEQTSGLRAISKSFNFVAHNFRVTLTYIVVRVIFLALYIFLILQALTGQLLSAFGTVLLSLFGTPILHTTKMMIYSYGRPTEAEMPFELSEPIWKDIALRLPGAAWRKMRIGLSEIAHFLASPRNLPFHVLATVSFLVGIATGSYVSSNGLVNFLTIQPGRINPAVSESFGPVLGVDIFLNNWLVSIATALAGLGFGLPSSLTIFFNGYGLGIVVPAFKDLTLFLVGILPHGVIEIPSLILSGSIGLKLGWAALRAKVDPSPQNQEFLSLTLKQTVYIVVGLAPLFFVAGAIEGNVTPIIMRLFGWTG